MILLVNNDRCLVVKSMMTTSLYEFLTHHLEVPISLWVVNWAGLELPVNRESGASFDAPAQLTIVLQM